MSTEPLQTAPPKAAPWSKNIGLLALALCVLGGVALFIKSQPSPAQKLVAQGEQSANAGRYREAVQKWNEAVRLDPNCADAWELLGEAYKSAQNYTAATEAFRRVMLLKPETPGAAMSLGACSVHAENQEELLQQAEQTLEREPNNLAALIIAASILTYRDDERKRLTYLRRLSELLPKDVTILTTRMQTLVKAHLFDEARPLIARLIELAPDNPAAYDFRGQMRLKEANSPQALAEAEADFLKALELKVPSPLPYLNLGKIYIKMRQPEKALAALDKAREQMPGKPDVYFAQRQAYELAGEKEKAKASEAKFMALRGREDRLTTLQKQCVAHPENFEIHLEAGTLMLEKGDFDKADFYLGQALALRPGEPRAREAMQRLQSLTANAPDSGGAP